MTILCVTPGNPLLWTFLMENFNLGIAKMSVIPENPLFPNPVLPKTSVSGILALGCISHADINLKLPRPGTKDLYQNTSVREDSPWRLQQIQDAGNHLQLAITHLAGVDKRHEFKSAAEVDSFLSRIMDALQRGRNVLVNPTKRTLEELHKSKNVKALQPPLPPELALSFYLQGFKLIFAVYHIIQEKNVSRFNRYQAECVVPWVNDVLLLLTIGMQTIQQLKDKVNIFNQYEDLNQLE